MSVPRILIVEDNFQNREVLSAMLEASGFEVLQAVNGSIGVQVAVEERPDLILMDISMPVMDGFEATRRIRADPRTVDIPIFFVSAHGEPETQRRAKAVGGERFFEKPVGIMEIIHAVNERVAEMRATA